MKFLVIAGGICTAIGLFSKEPTLLGLGLLLLATFAGIKFFKWGARTTTSAVSTALADRREEKNFQTNLRREVQRERELSNVRNEGTIQLLRAQVELIAKHKQEGANVEREIYDMRKKLLEYEREENKAMIGELMSTLDSI